MKDTGKNITIKLSFEKTTMPPFDDILVLGKTCPLGMLGVSKSLEILVPDGYTCFEVKDEHVASVIINKNILIRLSADKVLEILSKRVFPFIAENEIIKVSFTTKISYDAFMLEDKLE